MCMLHAFRRWERSSWASFAGDTCVQVSVFVQERIERAMCDRDVRAMCVDERVECVVRASVLCVRALCVSACCV